MAVSAPKTAGTFVVVVARTKPSSLARSTARLGQSLSRALSSPPLLPERRLRYFRPASRGPSEREGLASAAKIPLLGSHQRTSGRRRYYYDLEGARLAFQAKWQVPSADERTNGSRLPHRSTAMMTVTGTARPSEAVARDRHALATPTSTRPPAPPRAPTTSTTDRAGGSFSPPQLASTAVTLTRPTAGSSLRSSASSTSSSELWIIHTPQSFYHDHRGDSPPPSPPPRSSSLPLPPAHTSAEYRPVSVAVATSKLPADMQRCMSYFRVPKASKRPRTKDSSSASRTERAHHIRPIPAIVSLSSTRQKMDISRFVLQHQGDGARLPDPSSGGAPSWPTSAIVVTSPHQTIRFDATRAHASMRE